MDKGIIDKLHDIRKSVERLVKVDSYAKQMRKQRVLEDIDEIIIKLK